MLILSGGLVMGGTSAFANFTMRNLAVLQADSNTANNTTFGILEFNDSTSGQSPVSTTAILGTGVDAMRISGSATSTGYLSLTNDQTLLTFTAANSTNASSNVNTLNPRAVGTLGYTQAFTKATTYTGNSGSQTRSATSLDNTNWFIGDQGGLYTNGTNAASPIGNFRKVHAFGGAVYGMTASTTAAPVGTFANYTGSTYAGLAGLANGDSTYQDFYLVKSGSSGSSFDVLYTLQASSATAGTIRKFSLVSGSWVANGSFTTTFGGFGMAARKDGTGANIFVTTGNGAASANSLLKLKDVAGFNTTINIASPSVTLFTAASGKTIKGVDFVPVPEPATMATLTVGLLAVLRRRNRKA